MHACSYASIEDRDMIYVLGKTTTCATSEDERESVYAEMHMHMRVVLQIPPGLIPPVSLSFSPMTLLASMNFPTHLSMHTDSPFVRSASA
jgi:hypothetical protein